MYEYKAKVHRIIDGDTVDVTIDLGFECACMVSIPPKPGHGT